MPRSISLDGRRLVTASQDRTIKLWDTETYQEVFTLRGHTAGVVSLAISPDGTRIASGSVDRTARVWDTNPPTAENFDRRAAAEQVEALYGQIPETTNVIRALEADAKLPIPVRRAALEIARRAGGRLTLRNQFERARQVDSRAETLATTTSKAEALEAFRQARDLWTTIVTANPAWSECRKQLALALIALGDLERAAGHDEAADRAFDEALRIGEDLLGHGLLDRFTMWTRVALQILDGVGNRDRARRPDRASAPFRPRWPSWISRVPTVQNDPDCPAQAQGGHAGGAREAHRLAA